MEYLEYMDIPSGNQRVPLTIPINFGELGWAHEKKHPDILVKSGEAILNLNRNLIMIALL